MTEAESLLPGRQRDAESELTTSVNGEERLPSPLQTVKTQETHPLPAHSGQPPSPSMPTNGNEQHLIKNSAAVQSNKSKACKKKKKCLSDIFGHIVGGSKDSSTIMNTVDQFHTTTCALKEEPTDSPYADLDTVPMLHRPKRTSMSPIQDMDRAVRKEQASAKVKTKFTEKVKHPTDFHDSSGVETNKWTSSDTNSKQSLGSCNEMLYSSAKKHSLSLPASSRLMTRALKAEEDTDFKDALATSQISTSTHTDDCPDNTTTKDAPIKIEMSPCWESPTSASSSANHISPKRRARKPDKKQIRNGSLIKSKSVFSVQPVKIKTENVVPDLPSSPPPSSLSPMDAFQDIKELMFKSLVKEDNSDSELSAFRPDSNYKFSTFLMLLKDMHDTREKEGKPLTLPPSPVLIKEEPLVIPSSTGRDQLKGSFDGFSQGIKTEKDQSTKSTTSQNTTAKNKNRTKAIMSADTYRCENFPIHTQIGSSDKQRRKQRLPAKLKLGIPGLSSDLADLAYGREFVSGHADLAGPGSGPPVAPDPLGSYLDKNLESTVAPKKRWQMVEGTAERMTDVMSGASAEMNGSYAMRLSPDLELGLERQAENDFSDASSSAGKTHNAAVQFEQELELVSKKVMYIMCVEGGNSENKRLRKPTKRLLESTEEYEQIFAPKKKSKRNASESYNMVRGSLFWCHILQTQVHRNVNANSY